MCLHCPWVHKSSKVSGWLDLCTQTKGKKNTDQSGKNLSASRKAKVIYNWGGFSNRTIALCPLVMWQLQGCGHLAVEPGGGYKATVCIPDFCTCS